MTNKVKVVYACGKNGAFGLNNGLPWPHSPDDLKNFRDETKSCILVMGVNTFRSLPKLLPDRIHVVAECRVEDHDVRTKDGSKPHMTAFCPVNQVIAELKGTYDSDIAIIGGSDIIFRTITGADEIVETEFDKNFIADTWIKHDRLWLNTGRKLVEEKKFDGFTVRRYRKK